MNILEEFLQNKRDNCSSPLTIKSYSIDLTKFLPFLLDKSLGDITVSDLETLTILNVRNKLLLAQEKENLSVSTINRRLASLKSLMSYCASTYNIHNGIKTMKSLPDTRIKEVEYIEQEQVKALINKAKSDQDIEMYYILGMLFNTGLRSAELLSLEVEMCGEDYIIVYGKGGKLRRVELNTVARDCLKTYLETFNIKQGKILNMSYVTLRRHFSKYLKKFGINCSRMHTTRRSFTTNLIEKGGVDILPDVAEMLGHSSIQTLEKHYLGSRTKKITVSLLD